MKDDWRVRKNNKGEIIKKTDPKEVKAKVLEQPKVEENNDKNNDKLYKSGRRISPKSIANLKPPIKPGEVRNPTGRPKGKLNFDTRVDMAMELLARKYVDDFNKKKENKNHQIKLEDIDIEGDIFAQFINKARNGSDKMIDSFLDRRHGKATQKVELSGKDGNPIEYSIKLEEAKERLRKNQAKWFKK